VRRACEMPRRSAEADPPGMAKRYFEGEVRQLREKLGEKDVTLAKASRIQKELRWSLEVYNRELAMIRGGGRRVVGVHDEAAGSHEAARPRRSAEYASGEAAVGEAAAGTAPAHAKALGDVGAHSLWYSPLGSAPDSPAPAPPPRHNKPHLSSAGRGRLAGAGRMASAVLCESSSSSASPPPERRRRSEPPPASDANGNLSPSIGSGDRSMSLALGAAAGPQAPGGHARRLEALTGPDGRARRCWSPPLSLSPLPGVRHSLADANGESFEAAWWASSSVGSLELTGRIRADAADETVKLEQRLRKEREALKGKAAKQHEVSCSEEVR